MPTLTAPEAPMVRVRRDPAPSRVAYRLHRLWLTPFFRVLLRKGVPAFLLIFGAGVWFQSEERRTEFADWAEGVRQSIAERPEFTVQMMAIDGASPELADTIRELLPVRFPVSSFELDLATMRQTVAQLDAVASAEVRITRGGVLSVTVVERMPSVIWRSTTGIGTLDAQGHKVNPLLARLERPDLPLIAGEGAEKAVPEALALLAAAEPIAARVRGLVRQGERRWDIVIDPDIRLMLPEIDPVPALERIIALQEGQALLDLDINAVDMRIPARVTVRMNPDAVRSFRDPTPIPTPTPTGATLP
jgi:cell division protein FtsQ